MNKDNRDFLRITFETFLQNSHDMIFVKDINSTYIAASPTFAEMAGCKVADEVVGRSDFELFHYELAEHYRSDDKILFESEVPLIDYVEPMSSKDGKNRYCSTSKYLIRDICGSVIGMYGIARDVTAQIELQEEKERMALSRQMFDDVLEADLTKNKIIRAEGSLWVNSLHISSKTDFTEAVKILSEKFIHKDYISEFKQLYDINKLISDYNNDIKYFSHITYKANELQEYKWTEFTSRMYFSKISNTLRIVTFLKDLDEEVRSKEQLKLKAETDELTGIFNRKAIFEKIEKCLYQDFTDGQHALFFVDLDCFKQVNDNLGHPFGDRVLRETAQRLERMFRNDGMVGRIGGDEFLVFIKNFNSEDEVSKSAKNICSMIPFYHIKDGKELFVTCSVGVSLCTNSDKPFDQLYSEADQAMYKAKQSGRNKAEFYCPSP